jgi:hypothetical protein
MGNHQLTGLAVEEWDTLIQPLKWGKISMGSRKKEKGGGTGCC